MFVSGVILFVVSFLLLFLAGRVEGIAQWYAVNVYPWIVNTVGRVWGAVPFSVAEVLLYVVLFLVFVFGICLVIQIVRKKDGKRCARRYFTGLWFTASVLFLLYTLNCGINYQRKSFSECEKITVEVYSLGDLKMVCERLTQDVNTYVRQVERDEEGIMVLDGTEREQAVEAMYRLGESYDCMKGYYPNPKPLTGSWLLSVQNLTGIYAPFTVEANYNQDMVAYNIPFTACHELSHLRGFMQEEEANFIAYLSCMGSESAEFRYSGSLLGWIYCMNVLRSADVEVWKEVREQLSKDAEPDLQANSAFWASYDGIVAEVSETINDNYLKANGQSDGVESYDRMVDLLVAYYKK